MKKTTQRLFAALLIMLFVYTAVAKLSDVARFEGQLLNQNIPKWSAPILLWLIPISELLVTVLLIREATRQVGFYGSAGLMFLFTAYMGLVLLNVFDRTPCSCGGVLESMDFSGHFLFNLLFLIISVVGVFLSNKINVQNS